MKQIIFIDKNQRLVNKVKKTLGTSKVQIKCGDIFKEKGVIVTASNPDFTMGGGLDYLIAQKYPKECKQAQKTPNKNKRIGNVIFTITVDRKLKSNTMLVKKALRFAKKSLKKNETLLISGLGTGIGGLSYKDFANAFVEVFRKNKAPKNLVTRYKFMREGLVSDRKGKEWKIGKWEHENKIGLCECGFHASEKINDAFSYVQGEVLAIVECGGNTEKDEDGTKEVFQDMRIVKAFKWTKKDSVELAIFAAEQVIDNFEKEYPNDDRPRKAIEAAKEWLKNPTEKNRVAAESARSAAESARSAAESARSAAWSAWSAAESAAWSAAESAWSAAESAAWSAAESAAESARSAWSAAESARSALKDKIEKWFVKHISKLEEIK